MKYNKLAVAVASSALLGTLLVAAPAFANEGKGKANINVGLHAGDITGTGQPIVAGKVTATSSASITISNMGSTTFTVNTSDAVIVKKGATSTLSSVAVGDMVLVQGVVNGSVITATTIFDQTPKVAKDKKDKDNASTTPKGDDNGKHLGQDKGNKGLHIGQFFGGLGNFFRTIFGF
ncbi:MAG: hypothetical protein V4474_01830 [Patescibacteria group bacterium]